MNLRFSFAPLLASKIIKLRFLFYILVCILLESVKLSSKNIKITIIRISYLYIILLYSIHLYLFYSLIYTKPVILMYNIITYIQFVKACYIFAIMFFLFKLFYSFGRKYIIFCYNNKRKNWILETLMKTSICNYNKSFSIILTKILTVKCWYIKFPKIVGYSLCPCPRTAYKHRCIATLLVLHKIL